MSIRPAASTAHGVPEDAYAAEVWEDESPATAKPDGEDGPAATT